MQAIRQSTFTLARRAAVAAPAPSRRAALFSTSRIALDESPIKETAQKVNKVAGEAVLKGVIEPAEKVSETVKAAVGGATAEASQKAGELKEDAKGAATNASYTAEQAKAEAGKKANNVATEAKKATQ